MSYQYTSDSGVRPSTFSNIFSSETTWPIELKFHMGTPYDGGTKVCSKGPDHMTKMATMPIYGKKTFKILLCQCSWDLVCSIQDVGPTT